MVNRTAIILFTVAPEALSSHQPAKQHQKAQQGAGQGTGVLNIQGDREEF